ncbi:hypothetical protein NB640_12665 [Oxalobacter vibrioformis]|uniref:Beta-lactamase n=1 Tax=Oxalobacter vibrioformis TaxID=933080 RepID=A0A9E9P2M6_9BURK|nr:hypothetical protein [Oxalobacter vibrioformis]WAW10049.1 hypothetical protein NB640_12665 [Oxalobacter vibrioformis]
MKTVLKLFLVVLTCAIAGYAFSGELGDADALYDKGQYRKALEIYLKYPDHPGVQNNIGMIYMKPGMRNEKEALKWFHKSGAQGNTTALYHLGMAYQKGIGVNADKAMALKYYRDAADRGMPEAMNAVGLFYDNGWGIRQNEQQAAKWYQKAADHGNALGHCNLAYVLMYGKIIKHDYNKAHAVLNQCLQANPDNACCNGRLSELYADGWGVSRDFKKAHELRVKAAAGDDAVDMYMMGRDLDYGIGVEKDQTAALNWYQKAAAKDHAKSMYRLYEVYEYGKLGQAVDKKKAAEWRARAEKAMKEQGLSRNEWVDDFRLKMEEADKD